MGEQHHSIISTSEDSVPIAGGMRIRRVLLIVFLIVAYALGFTYHVAIWNTGAQLSGMLSILFHAVSIVGYTALWMILAQFFKQQQLSPSRIFWTILVVGVLFTGLTGLFVRIGQVSDLNVEVPNFGFDYETGLPLSIITVIKVNIVSLMMAAFAFFLLLKLQSLVLYKRTKRSRRNWYLMLAFMFFASLSTLMQPWEGPGAESTPIEYLAMVPAFAMMTINAFRLSWIAFLSFKEKAASIGLALLLLIFITIISEFGQHNVLLPGAYEYARYYSYPLDTFYNLSLVFGILYCTTSFLSLLFHLPTTSDFQKKANEVTAMHSLTDLVRQVFDSEKLYRTIVSSAVETGSAQSAWLAVADPQSGSLRPKIISTFNIDSERVNELVDTAALFEEICTSREPVLLSQAAADHRISARPGDSLGSMLVMPLLARDEVLGALFTTKDVTYGFESDDIEAISVFVAQASLALDNARLFEEQIEKERLARELDIAREVQKKLLPQRLPTFRGLSLAASSVPAHEVGGDYYDFIQLDNNRVAVIIADVSGKGTSAAFYMAELQGIFHSLSYLASTPTAFLNHANRALAGSLEKHVFISVIYGVLDLENEEFILARGGHCPVATINLGGEARYIRTQGLGLGLDRSSFFENRLSEECVPLQPGDVFVLYTDGVVESRNAAGEEYGYDRLLNTLKENRHEDAEDIHSVLLEDLNRFLEHDDYDDDMTLVVMKWHGIDTLTPMTSFQTEISSISSDTKSLRKEVQPG